MSILFYNILITGPWADSAFLNTRNLIPYTVISDTDKYVPYLQIEEIQLIRYIFAIPTKHMIT